MPSAWGCHEDKRHWVGRDGRWDRAVGTTDGKRSMQKAGLCRSCLRHIKGASAEGKRGRSPRKGDGGGRELRAHGYGEGFVKWRK